MIDATAIARTMTSGIALSLRWGNTRYLIICHAIVQEPMIQEELILLDKVTTTRIIERLKSHTRGQHIFPSNTKLRHAIFPILIKIIIKDFFESP